MTTPRRRIPRLPIDRTRHFYDGTCLVRGKCAESVSAFDRTIAASLARATGCRELALDPEVRGGRS